MFVQIIHGRTHDAAGAQRLLAQWADELAGDAGGWLGSTAGVTDEGDLFVTARFESADAARRNSGRPEQDMWWQEFAKVFDSPPTLDDCDDVELFLDGGSDDAGFVQVIQSRITDADAWAAANERMRHLSRDDLGRADIIGGLTARAGDHVTDVVYFTDEPAARRGEQQEPPPAAREAMEAMEAGTAAVAEVRYLDLREPWLASA